MSMEPPSSTIVTAAHHPRTGSVRSILLAIVLCTSAVLYVIAPPERFTAVPHMLKQQFWTSTPPTIQCKSNVARHCKSTIVTCPRDHYPEPGVEDLRGSRPFVCFEAIEPALNVLDRHVFNISLCRGSHDLVLQVAHIEGLLRGPVNRQYSTGPDFITAQIVGPELRLVPFAYKGDGIYKAIIGAAVPGQYVFDITVAFTPEVMGGPERPAWPTRNFLLAANETWKPSEVSEEEVLLDVEATRLSTNGRWVAIGDDYPTAVTAITPSEGFIGHRCHYLGEYAWTPSITEVSSSWSRFKGPEEVLDCLRSIKGTDAAFSRVLLLGDSQTRNTFNAMLNLIWPGDDVMQATKNFKSLTDSQCFGGSAFGTELCFQWANEGTDAATLERYLQEFDRVTMNFGQHQVYKPDSSLTSWIQEFEPKISSLAEAVHRTPGASERLIWLQTYPSPNTNWKLENKDRRKLPVSLDMIARTSSLFKELQLPELTVLGLVLPYHDCSFDGCHFDYGVPEEILKEKLLPWICPSADGK